MVWLLWMMGILHGDNEVHKICPSENQHVIVLDLMRNDLSENSNDTVLVAKLGRQMVCKLYHLPDTHNVASEISVCQSILHLM